MTKSNIWRLAIIIGVILASTFFAWPLEKQIHLGLDLQGGMHLKYEVDVKEALESTLDNIINDLSKFLGSHNIKIRSIGKEKGKLLVRLRSDTDINKAEEVITSDYPILTKTRKVADGGVLIYKLTSDHEEYVYKNSVSQALETLRNRIDQFGVSEPSIQREGENRIIIQLPGIKDRQRAIDLIGKTARLEFRMLNEAIDPASAFERGIPKDSAVLYEKEFDRITKKIIGRKPYVIKKKVELTGDKLANAEVRFSQMNLPYVAIDFNNEGGKIFAQLTSDNVGRRMAIVLDDSVYSAPVIREAITGGSAMIEGNFIYEEANDLAIILRAGSLPAPLIKLEERTVGPSLGRDSIARGINSIVIGSIIVFLFMIFYYRLGGIIADIALGLNIVILSGALAYFGATLTLPGIAGIILTIGMAVDANVLVFERIREEIRNGKTVRVAVDSGFSKAFLTIIDANVTTLIAALVLFQFGTGPIKGFAVTLSIGVIASMFTAIFVSKTAFKYFLGNRRITELKI